MASIYLHIPFCRRICGYCDFFKSARVDKLEQTVQVMMEELEREREFLSSTQLSTIYFGGGTPSLLSPSQVGAFLERIASLYDTSGVKEITLETNPDDLNREYLREIKRVGVDRLSIGVQSFDDGALKFMNRRHSAEQAIRAIEEARGVGFENIAIDLIFGVDGFGGETLSRSLQKATALGVEHIAAYHLTIEPSTLFARRVERGEFRAVEEEVSEQEYEMVRRALTDSGYEHYEISNYALDGRRSKHNSAYWSGAEYLGIGAGAHSFARGVRRWSEGSLDRYLSGGEDGSRYESEVLSDEERRNEIVMTSLRRVEGINIEEFCKILGTQSVERLLKDSQKFIASGELELNDKWLRIPTERFLRSDMIIEQLFLMDEK